MPQLAPINWMLLFLFFWFIIFLVSVLIWWSFNSYYGVVSPSDKSLASSSVPVVKANVWNWF